MATFADIMNDFGQAFHALAERVDELERLETFFGTLDLNGATLSITGDLVSDAGTLDLNTHTLSLNSDFTLNSGSAGRLAGYTSASVLDDSTVAKTGSGLLTLNALSAQTVSIASGGTLDLNAQTLSLPLVAANIPALDASKITTGLLPIARGGTGASTPSAARTALGTTDAANITTGTLNPARLGSGTPSASTLLFGDGAWSSLAAADIPALDASKITTGLLPIARGGTGASTPSAALAALGGVGGSGTNGAITTWNSTTALTFINNFYFASNVLNVPGVLRTTAGNNYDFGGYTAAADAAAIGYVTMVIDGTARRLMVRG